AGDGVQNLVLNVKRLSVTERQFVNRADCQALWDVGRVDRSFQILAVCAVLITDAPRLLDVAEINRRGDAVTDQLRFGVRRQDRQSLIESLMHCQQASVVDRITK